MHARTRWHLTGTLYSSAIADKLFNAPLTVGEGNIDPPIEYEFESSRVLCEATRLRAVHLQQ